MDSDDNSSELLKVKGKKTKRRVKWTLAGEESLLKIWAKKQAKLRANRRSRETYQEIADELYKFGFHYSGLEIKIKLHNLSNRYKVERSKMEQSGVRSDWNFYDYMQQILGGVHVRKLENLMQEDQSDAETTENFTFVESSDKFMGGLLPEEEMQTAASQKKQRLEIFNDKRKHFETEEDIASQSDFSSVAPQLKNHINHDNNEHDYYDHDVGGDGKTGNCLNKLANTVNDVVKFVMKTEAEKSRNDAFLKVLDSFLLQLPDSTQDVLKMEMLNSVFNKVMKLNGEVKSTAETEAV